MTVTARVLTDAAELAPVDPLYRRAFGIDDGGDGVNLRLLVGIGANSGHVVGAYDDDRLVGFGLSFLARDRPTGRLYEYSQTVAVAPEAQGRGVGRVVKFAQRDAALADGIDLMRWSFDPMYSRNAHFNLDVLGGRARRLHPNFYGDAPPDRDAGERTDRLVVDWELTAHHDRPVHALPGDLTVGDARQLDGGWTVAIPADWPRFRSAHSASAAAGLRARTVATMSDVLGHGLTAVSCRRVDEHTAAYLFRDQDDA